MKLKKNRLLFSLAVSLSALSLSAVTPGSTGREPVLAWWGTWYPEFSFSAPDREEKGETEEAEGKVKISFWLAKAFDWC